MSQPPPGTPSRLLSRAQQRAGWIFGSLLLVFLMAVVWFAPERLAGFKQGLLAVLAALLAGLMAFFLTGDLGIQRTWLRATGGMGAFALVLLLWLRLTSTSAPDIYRVRVTVLGPQGQPVEEAEVRSSVGGEKKRAEGGWELDISASTLPVDRHLTLFAEKASAFWRGRRDLTLGKDYQPAVVVELREDHSATVSGSVQDVEGNSLPGARVSVAGHTAEAVTTDRTGGFSIAAHAAAGQIVRLRAEKEGFRPVEQDHPAGSAPATLVLKRP